MGFDGYIQLSALDAVPADLVRLALPYWKLDAVDEYDGPKWSLSASQLATDGLGQIHHVAAAAVRAVVRGAVCEQCGGSLALRTRSDFATVLAGGHAVCVTCDPKYVTAAAKVRAAFAGEKYQKASSGRVQREAEKKWNEDRLGVIKQKYRVELTPDVDPPLAPFDAAVAMLAILRFSSFRKQSPGWIPPVDEWDTLLAAGAGKTFEAVERAFKAGLMRIYPWAQEAFVYKPPSFQVALSEAHGDLASIASPALTGSYYPLLASYYVPFGPSMGTALEILDGHLVGRVALTSLNELDRISLVEMIRAAMADEAVRYFHYRIEYNSLPLVPEQHVPRLREAAFKAAEYMPLGRLYAQAWRAAKDGAAAAHRRGLPNSPNMSTFAVNQFERFVADRANVDNGKSFGEDDSVPLAAMTLILFRTVLDVDPMVLSLREISEKLESVELPDDGSWDWAEASDSVRKAIVANLWSSDALRSELQNMRDTWTPVQAFAAPARVADRLANHFDLYAQGQDRQAAALEAVDLATLLARAGGDDATAAQTIVLCLEDALAKHRSAVGAVEQPSDVQSEDVSAPARDEASTVRRGGGQRASRPPRRNGPKKKRKRR